MAKGSIWSCSRPGRSPGAVRYRINSRPCKLTLGSLSLAAARKAADALYEVVQGT
jgi:hypothetical protein